MPGGARCQLLALDQSDVTPTLLGKVVERRHAHHATTDHDCARMRFHHATSCHRTTGGIRHGLESIPPSWTGSIGTERSRPTARCPAADRCRRSGPSMRQRALQWLTGLRPRSGNSRHRPGSDCRTPLLANANRFRAFQLLPRGLRLSGSGGASCTRSSCGCDSPVADATPVPIGTAAAI